jgi:hypothetical protein
MRGVLSRGRRAAAACVLIVALAAPTAMASDTTSDPRLWAEFTTWLQARLGVQGGFAGADEDSFTLWLMSRIGIPGG